MSLLYTFSQPTNGVTPNTILSSTDGVTWTTLPGSSSIDFASSQLNYQFGSTGLATTINGVNGGNPFFFKLLNNEGMIYSSNGGANWILLQSLLINITNQSGSRQTISGNSNCILYAGYNFNGTELYVAKSTDGSTWTEYLIDTGLFPDMPALHWNGTKWVIAYYSSTGIRLKESIDGENWSFTTTITNPDTSFNRIYNLNYFNNIWVILTQDGKVIFGDSSSSSWTLGTNVTNFSCSMSKIGNTLYIININGVIYETTDLLGWNTLSPITNIPSGVFSIYLNYVGNNYVIVTDGNNGFNDISYLAYNSSTTPSTWTWDSGNTDQRSLFIAPLSIGSEVPCLVEGMEVSTDNGLKKVEDLKVGDTVLDILNRSFTITQILSKKVIGNKQNIPYIIPKDYFEKDLPKKDIYLSYNHGYFYNGEWRLPIYDDNLKQDESLLGKEITYYHVALPNYSTDKLACYNLPVDSFDSSKYNQDNMI